METPNRFHETLISSGYHTGRVAGSRNYRGGRFPFDKCFTVSRDGSTWSTDTYDGGYSGTTIESLDRYIAICVEHQAKFFAGRKRPANYGIPSHMGISHWRRYELLEE